MPPPAPRRRPKKRPEVTLDQLPPVPSADQATDGRIARGLRTRQRVAEALVDLLREGDPEPTAKSIAERAGVSLRLVFHHFSDIDDLYQAVAALQLERHWKSLPSFPPALPLPTRIDRTIRQRGILYEEISPVRRAALRRAGGSQGVTELLAYTDGLLIENLTVTFAPELDPQEPGQRAEILAALDAATSWELWDRMRERSGLNMGTARRVMTRTVYALLGLDETG